MTAFIGEWLNYRKPMAVKGKYVRRTLKPYAAFGSWAFRMRRYRKARIVHGAVKRIRLPTVHP